MSQTKQLLDVKQRIIDDIIEIEGGYVNDSSDSGGETKYGITKIVANKWGYNGDMKNLPYDIAFKIYSSKYWDVLKLDSIGFISTYLAEELADTGINMGVVRSGKFLQRALNVLNLKGTLYPDLIVDGIVGNKTIEALKSFTSTRRNDGVEVLLKMLNCLQGEFYISLAERREKDEKFIFGWFKNRVRLHIED